MSKALLIDVGGTNMRYALASIEKDDLSNSNIGVLDRILQITHKSVSFYQETIHSFVFF